jgi:hypothetical protein|tara:strand:- start:1403 stop:1699 length:297 start_codon:yes stop_codon:yes gene_type:complete
MFKIELSEDEGWYLLKAVKHESAQLERLINRLRQSEKGRLNGRLSIDVSNDFHSATGIIDVLEQHFKSPTSNRFLASRADDVMASPYHKLPARKREND